MSNIDSMTGLAQGSFGIGTFRAGERVFPGLVYPSGDVVDVSADYADTHAIFDDWHRAFDRLHNIASGTTTGTFRFDTLTPLPPVARPNVLCAGSNYRQHVAEMMTYNRFNQHNRLEGESDHDFFKRNLEIVAMRRRDGMPFIWASLHSALIGANDDIILPAVAEHHDWELELTAVIGGGGRYLSPEEGRALIAGYCVTNDLGSVDTFRRRDVNWGYDWIGKHQPGFKPCGPFIVPAQFVTLNDDVRIGLKLNGKVKQDWPVTDMIFSVEEFISYASERLRLMPGDLLLTGSPPGNGALHGEFLQPGDVMDSEITGLGRQHNRCIAEPDKRAEQRWRLRGEFA